jgi:hypothetical protein
MGWEIVLLFFVVCTIGFVAALHVERMQVANQERRERKAFEREMEDSDLLEDTRNSRSHRDKLNLRLNHLWLRKLQMDDERMAIFEEACDLYQVDPEECSFERDYVEECFLYSNTGMTPGMTQIRIDELRMDREQNCRGY